MLRAMSKTSGALHAGILNTLGLWRYEPALPNIKKLLVSPDPVVAQAAAAALGEIGGASAAKALRAARRTASEALRGHIDAALLVCADRFLASGQQAAAALSSTAATPIESLNNCRRCGLGCRHGGSRSFGSCVRRL